VTARHVPVLLYHSVADDTDTRYVEWAVAPDVFAAHIEHLAREGYTALTITELVERAYVRGERLPPRTVAITFDDGLEDFHAAGLAVLRRHGLAATVFVTAGCVGATSTWLGPLGEGRRPMCSWDQLRAHRHPSAA